MSASESYSFLTTKGVLKLNLINAAEPNNGRMLYKVSLFLEDKNLTDAYFGNWPYVNYYLSKYIAFSTDQNWFYIPKENEHFLINATLEKILLPSISLSAATFIGNSFFGDCLFVFTYEEILSKNLQTGNVSKFRISEEKIYFKEVVIVDSKSIKAILSNGLTKFFSFDLRELP